MKYTIDFETTTGPTYELEGRVRVWSWASMNIGTKKISGKGIDIDSFFEWVLSLSESSVGYFHNLKFDGAFILDWLLSNGWRHSGERQPGDKEFTTLITEMGVFYEIKLLIGVKGRKKIYFSILDSLKKLPFSARRIAEAFDLDMRKGYIDYDKYRPIGYQPTDKEWDYLFNDVSILAHALDQQMNEGLDKMTIGADAMADYKDKFNIDGKGNNWAYHYPLLNEEIDAWIRRSYKGGFVYLKEEHREQVIPKTISYDVNSLYPYVMKTERFPIGVPIYYKGKYEMDESMPLYIQSLAVIFKVKDGYLPTIQLKNNHLFGETEYITDTKGEIVDLYLTSIDLKLFLEHHDITYIEYIEGYKFRASDNLFTDYINNWNDIKEASTGASREFAKLMLNNLYGKFGAKSDSELKIPYLDNGKLKYKRFEGRKRQRVYIPVASFITSYAREMTIRSSQLNYDRFIYADTDSIHLIDHDLPLGLEVHSKRLGAWACEGRFGESKYLRAKTYIRRNSKRILEITCAGLPNEARQHITFKNFKLGAVYPGKLSISTVKGGSLLKPTNFTIHSL